MSSMRPLLYLGAGGLLLAVGDWPKESYQLLRFFVCALCTFAAYVALRDRSPLAVGFLVAGVLFNPIAKVQMDKSYWIVADLFAAAFFVAVAVVAPRLDAARMTGRPIATEATPEPAPVELSS